MGNADKLHADEVAIDLPLVRAMIAQQFPSWADEALEPVNSAGTDNAIYRLGSDKVVRLPRIEQSGLQVEKEQRWLHRLAPFLPLAIPTPLTAGTPTLGYPWTWSVYKWLEGEDASVVGIGDPMQTATDLAGFVDALHRVDASGGPVPGRHNFFRGVPLAERDADVQAALASLELRPDIRTLEAAWERALQLPPWRRDPVWVHGDLIEGNLLMRDGRLHAVLDFGMLGIGDPAVDLIPAWSFMSSPARSAFRAALAVDDATWERGRGWALSSAVVALPYYRSHLKIVSRCERTIAEVLSDDSWRS